MSSTYSRRPQRRITLRGRPSDALATVIDYLVLEGFRVTTPSGGRSTNLVMGPLLQFFVVGVAIEKVGVVYVSVSDSAGDIRDSVDEQFELSVRASFTSARGGVGSAVIRATDSAVAEFEADGILVSAGPYTRSSIRF